MKTELLPRMRAVGGLMRRAGPYLALEIVLPGGTAFALMLFLYQRRRQQLRAGGAPNAFDVLCGAALRAARALVALLPALTQEMGQLPRLRATV